ncbi:antibiotic biosynthesis monooxygenase [Saccharothrix deserti]|uniref:antibiotic biosynthesis monooxygenase n=1 Tax=Saccharothrix deserti TaxID=2593674 RepID=UPI00131AACEC|nr:antibiotic biosynthesis monooxygenase [Saccharothrix deserti]
MDLTREDAKLVLVNHGRVPFEPRPDGLLDVRWLEHLDSGDVVTYSQWSGPANVDGAVAYRRYRSGGLAEPERPVGCVVLVTAEFDRPDVAEEWIDLVFAALAADEVPHPGGISATFHVSEDGMRMLNYAEWTSAQAHKDALARGNGSVGLAPEWQRVQSFPALKKAGVKRYRVVGE